MDTEDMQVTEEKPICNDGDQSDPNLVEMTVLDAQTNNTTPAEKSDTSSLISSLEVGPEAGPLVQKYCELAAVAQGKEAADLIMEALEAPGLYVFAELLHMPNIKKLSEDNEFNKYYRLLEVFAYGVYNTYLEEVNNFPIITPSMQKKLRHLTLVSMASSEKSILLEDIQKKLDLSSRRELEDLIIEAIYADIVHGKLDQSRGMLEVDYALGRDIKPEDIPKIASTLHNWSTNCLSLLDSLSQMVNTANSVKEASLTRQAGIDAAVAKVKFELKRQGACSSELNIDEDNISDSLRDARKALKLKKNVAPMANSSVKSQKFWTKSS